MAKLLPKHLFFSFKLIIFVQEVYPLQKALLKNAKKQYYDYKLGVDLRSESRCLEQIQFRIWRKPRIRAFKEIGSRFVLKKNVSGSYQIVEKRGIYFFSRIVCG